MCFPFDVFVVLRNEFFKCFSLFKIRIKLEQDQNLSETKPELN